MQTVTIIPDCADQSTWSTHQVEDIRPFLMEQFPQWPDTARIYKGEVAEIFDITPACQEDVDRLASVEEPIYVVVFPGDPWTIAAVVIVIVIAVVAMVAVMLMAPTPPSPDNRNNQSPSNEISGRTNKARPLARIPDNYGTVRIIPDLLAVPYSIYENHQEVELSYMCLGRGEYEFARLRGLVYDVKDGPTPITEISGTSAEFYGPNTSPNSGDTPILTIGDSIDTLVMTATKTNSVNGQVLRSPNAEKMEGDTDIYFQFPNEIHLIKSSSKDFTEQFAADDLLHISKAFAYSEGDISEGRTVYFYGDGSFMFTVPDSVFPDHYEAGKPITLSGAVFYSGLDSLDLSGQYVIESVYEEPSATQDVVITLVNPEEINSDWGLLTSAASMGVDIEITCPSGTKLYNLDGLYTVSSVSIKEIVLSTPSTTNADWLLLEAMEDEQTAPISPTLYTSGPKWVGPFILDDPDMSYINCNVVALNGLYMENATDQLKIKVWLEVEIKPVNELGQPIGDPETFTGVVIGSAESRSTRAVTIRCNPTFTGRCSIRMKRITHTNTTFEGNVVDEVKWQHCYSMGATGKRDFGDITSVQVKTYATAGALALKERKFNVLATRKIPKRIGSTSTFTDTNFASDSAADIICAIAMDPYIGRRTISEIDVDSIYNGVADITEYFGHRYAGYFACTFDQDTMSYEEHITTVAEAIFSKAYRRGNVLKLSFEKLTEDSTLLFCHRNKIPGSETRTVRFGIEKDWDGVEYEFVDPVTDAPATYYLPSDRSARNPKKIKSVGVRSRFKAHLLASREWNKLQYQNIATEFEACQEAELLVLRDRILVADNTRTGTQDGEVRVQTGMALTLSQPVTFTTGITYTIFLQLADGTTQSMAITAGSTAYEVNLSEAPRLPLVVDAEMYARTTYIIVGSDEPRATAFLLMEREQQSNFTSTVRAINYDSRYYDSDQDYRNGVIDINGYAI